MLFSGLSCHTYDVYVLYYINIVVSSTALSAHYALLSLPGHMQQEWSATNKTKKPATTIIMIIMMMMKKLYMYNIRHG